MTPCITAGPWASSCVKWLCHGVAVSVLDNTPARACQRLTARQRAPPPLEKLERRQPSKLYHAFFTTTHFSCSHWSSRSRPCGNAVLRGTAIVIMLTPLVVMGDVTHSSLPLSCVAAGPSVACPVRHPASESAKASSQAAFHRFPSPLQRAPPRARRLHCCCTRLLLY